MWRTISVSLVLTNYYNLRKKYIGGKKKQVREVIEDVKCFNAFLSTRIQILLYSLRFFGKKSLIVESCRKYVLVLLNVSA